MIRLRKGPKPDVLVKKEAEWTQEYQEGLADPTKMTETVKFRYRHKEIKEALRRDAHNKCIYCEGPVSFGETDHLRPVSQFPDEVVKWENLGLVCKECNTYKCDYTSPSASLVNPYVDDPSDHLMFLGPLVVPVAGDERGLATYLALQLDRLDLVQKRSLRLTRLIPLVHQWMTHSDQAVKKLLWKQLLSEADDPMEYAAVVRGYLVEVTGKTWAVLRS